MPAALQSAPDDLIKGYCANERGVDGAGSIVAFHPMADRVVKIFADPDITFDHVRSARNNCYQCRIDRA